MNKKIKYIVGIIAFLVLVMVLILVSSKKTTVEPTDSVLNNTVTSEIITSVPSKTNNQKQISLPKNETVNSSDITTSLSSTDWTWQYTLMANGTKKAAPNNDKFVISFAKNKTVTSTTDCNSLKSTFSIKGDSITFEPFISTKKFCVGSFETQYIQQLGQVASYGITGDELRLNLTKDAGTMFFVLKYKDLSATPTNAVLKIDNTAYRLVSYNGEPIPDAIDYTLSFKNGSVNAKFCNAMSGQYTLDDHTIKANMVSTLMYCQSPVNLMDIENSFASIGSGINIVQDGTKLTLTNTVGDTLVFMSVAA